jgi:hypothetical protein
MFQTRRAAPLPEIKRLAMRRDQLTALSRRIRSELTALRQLARDRRIASSRLPAMIRTGPAAPEKRKELAR